jgi:hypothetical protein
MQIFFAYYGNMPSKKAADPVEQWGMNWSGFPTYSGKSVPMNSALTD